MSTRQERPFVSAIIFFRHALAQLLKLFSCTRVTALSFSYETESEALQRQGYGTFSQRQWLDD